MDNWTPTHTWACCTHAWWTLKLAFILLCLIGATLTILWIAGVALGAYVEGRQERATRRRNNYRVGGVIR